MSAPDATGYRIRTIPELVRDAARSNPDRVWLIQDDATLTFAQTERATGAVAASTAALGVTKGDVALVVAHNTPAHVLAWLGLVRLGAVVLPVNPASTAAELAGFLDQARPRLAVFDPHRDAVVRDAREQAREHVDWVDVHELAAARGDPPDVALEPLDAAVLIPTSGTTGRSKLVTQTHQAYVLAGEGFPWWMQLTPEDRLITSLPIFHVNAPAYSLLGSMAIGASVVLLSRFSPGRFLDEARRHGATEFNMIGAMLEMLMRQPERADDADNPLRLCYTGPSPTRERQLEIEARFGIEVVCGYGMSESTYGTFWAHGERPFGTLGTARQHPVLGHVNDARVVGDDGAEVAVGEIGELQLRNPAMMLGYYEMPDETNAVLVDHWLHTGDLVRRDAEGTFTFVTRKKEVIRRRGENLAPAEVEDALAAHPDVLESAVIAVPSELGEDEIKAFVVARPGSDLDVGALRESLFTRLARFKVPRFVEVVDDLPRTPTGRLAKHKLPTERTATETDFDAASVRTTSERDQETQRRRGRSPGRRSEVDPST